MDNLMNVSRFSSYKASTGVEKLSSTVVVVVLLFKMKTVYLNRMLWYFLHP